MNTDKINLWLRKYINAHNQKRLKNRDFSIISSNCNGGVLLHDLGMRFNTPTINLWIEPDDFIRFLQNLPHYLDSALTFIDVPDMDYPVALLDDVKIYFQHYHTAEEASAKWQERASRINFDNLFIMFTDRDGCTYQNLVDFEALPYKNKVVFTHLPYPEFSSAHYIKGWETDPCVGVCFGFVKGISGKKHYDSFDYVSWFNQGY